jgi:Flp pilus assembly protein TadD
MTALFALGNHYQHQGQFVAAIACYQRALQEQPDNVALLCNLGVALAARGAVAEAIAHFQQALRLRADAAIAWCNLGHLLRLQGQLEAASEHLQQAVRLCPGVAEAHNNLGAVYLEQGELCRAIEHLQEAIRLKPGYVEAHTNLGSALRQRGQLTTALAHHQEALRLSPDCAEAHWNRALTLLASGDLQQGWVDYEWRWRTTRYPPRPCPYPRWQGTPLAARTILVRAEQGVGDELLFVTCLPELIATAGHVMVECDPRLAPLLSRSFPTVTICARHRPTDVWRHQLPPIDFYIDAGSLPHFFRPTLGHFPPHNHYLLPDARRQAQWQKRLQALGPGLTVGLSWRSQHLTTRRSRRYTPFDQWQAVLSLPHIHWINLQYGDCTAELTLARERWGVTLHTWDDLDLFHDLEGVAGLIAALDLVLAPANSVAHLAGSLGQPVWQLSVYEPDEMWLGTQVSPWFPSLRLYRQAQAGDWQSVLRQLALALALLA